MASTAKTSSGGATGRYGGASAEERRAERRERLLDAALELLGSEGWPATTVRGVCAEARLNPRYFYESFRDLDDLLVAAFDRIAADMTEAILAGYAEAPDTPHAKAHATVGTMVRHVTDDPRRARVLFVEALGNEALAHRRIQTMHQMSELVATYGREFYRRRDDSDPIADMAAQLLVGGIAELLISWLDGRLHMTREQLIDDLVELFVATGTGALAIAEERARKR